MVAVQNHTVANVNITDIKELDEKVKSIMTKSQNILPNGQQKADMCTVSGKEDFRTYIMNHIEANHLEGVSIPCNFCGKAFRSRNVQKVHTRRDHK